MLEVFEMILKTEEKTNAMGETEFKAFICMIIEEWCKANAADIRNVSSHIFTAIKEVNEELGKYE